MNRSKVTWSLLGALGVLALGAAALGRTQAPTDPIAPPGTPTWSYLCFTGDSAKEVMEKANRAGAQGWEMVSAAPGEDGSIWCFRQAKWARPVPQE